MRSKVVLPAPFGPNKPNILPSLRVKLISSTAFWPQNISLNFVVGVCPFRILLLCKITKCLLINKRATERFYERQDDTMKRVKSIFKRNIIIITYRYLLNDFIEKSKRPNLIN